MSKQIFIILFLVIIGNVGCSGKYNSKEIKSEININKPIYELAVEAQGCYLEVYVNDVPVYFNYNIGATVLRMPINNFIPKSGGQKVSFKMISVDGKPFSTNTYASLTINEYPKGETQQKKTVFSYQTSPFESENEGSFSIENSFETNIPYQLIDWRQGVDLTKEDPEIIRKEIEEIYRDYTEAFKNADLSKYKKLVKWRQENAFASMYYTQDQRTEVEKSYVDGIQNQKVKLFPLENYKLVFYGNGKLAGFQKKNEAPGIYIDSENKDDAFLEYILLYRKSKNAPLEVIL
ncbi:hypothetical protein [Chryseobacterium jejuense]|uniref:Uncharacterized protein n=1 Tax=Chryseobacterium jejuense TaxID=445960 RepID=A0A2X2X0Y7_CHRJE|nr:hypothetical protein [Chryseobacterium jejuense]SDI19585.1 hypothetical protein SAMN05421542_0388 [Chryseobacterium jejuense]SQB46656.1 Uncharacterised protein [Chryseobacterium jejuense]